MYPRLSSQSRLWEGMGSWDALVSMPFSEISAALVGWGACLYRSCVSSLSFNAKLSLWTKIGRIQTYSTEYVLNTFEYEMLWFDIAFSTLDLSLFCG